MAGNKEIPISKTKIVVPPRRSELLTRPRLDEVLNPLFDNKLILLSAPAGYGKTSLLIDLAHRIEMPVCWLALDTLDRDPQRFMAYLIAALEERFQGALKNSKAELKRLTSLEQDKESLLVTLTNELYANVEGDFLLILDDYHLLDEVPAISDLLNRFLELVVENCHILLSSRTLPPLKHVALMLAREQVAGLSFEELAFQPGEVQSLYAQNHHQHLSDTKAQELVTQTDGWIAGIILSDRPGTIRASSADNFSGFLREEVLDQQPAEIREFLLLTSLMEEFNAELCEIVLAPLYMATQNWQMLMSVILEKNLFVLPLDSDGRWLRYHHTFRDFLQNLFKEEYPAQVSPILTRMVTAYEKFGDWEKAYFTCKQLSDPESLANVIERAGTAMLQGALTTLENWLRSLPPALLHRRPGLISLRGMLEAAKGELQAARPLLDQAISMYRQTQDFSNLTLTLTRRAQCLRLLGLYEESLADVEEALGLAEPHLDLLPLYAEALRLKGLNLFRLGRTRNAVGELEHSLSLYRELGDSGSLPMLLAETAMVRATIGEIAEAKDLYQQALDIWKAENNLYSQAGTLNNLGFLHHQQGEYEQAAEVYEAGLECARASSNQHAESLILAGLGDLYLELGELDAAENGYLQAEKVSNKLDGLFISNYLILSGAHLAIRRGDSTAASEILTDFQKTLEKNPSHYDRGLWALLKGRNDLLQDKPTQAVNILKESKDFFLEDGRNAESHWAMVWLMAAYVQAGQLPAAKSEFRQLLNSSLKPTHALLIALLQAADYLNVLVTDPQIGRVLNDLLIQAEHLRERILVVRRVLRRHAQAIPVPSANLVIQAFGRAEVTHNGRQVSMADWKTRAVRELFFYFLSNTTALTKEQIGNALWVEAIDQQTLHKRFKDEIYRLRRAVGKNVVVFDNELYRFNRALDYEYDVEAFEGYIRRAHQVTGDYKKIEAYQKAIDMVQGPYLGDVDADWALLERERLGQIYNAALEELSHLYLDTGQLVECLQTGQLALKQDPYNELPYQYQMRAYAALGDRPAILRVYQTCKSIFQEGLSIAPTAETERLYRELFNPRGGEN